MKDLVAKLAKAALEVGGSLKADKRNQDQKYDYLSADKILSVCGQALFTQGLAVIPQVSAQEITLVEYTDSYGKSKKRYDCLVTFSITVTDGEGTIVSPWFGMGSDYVVPDKAMYKAITSGHKYFLMKLFCIGEGNGDSEHEGEDEQPKGNPAQRQPAPTNGNGKPVQAQPPAQQIGSPINGGRIADDQPTEWMLKQWHLYATEAESYGIEFVPIDPMTITKVQLAERGKQLKALIDEAAKAIDDAMVEPQNAEA